MAGNKQRQVCRKREVTGKQAASAGVILYVVRVQLKAKRQESSNNNILTPKKKITAFSSSLQNASFI